MIDAERLCRAVNALGQPTVRLMFAALKEEFPEHGWFLTRDGRVDFERGVDGPLPSRRVK